ncbi:UNVERIFIED_CONTAM: cnot6l [Trichonephila clavipes]
MVARAPKGWTSACWSTGEIQWEAFAYLPSRKGATLGNFGDRPSNFEPWSSNEDYNQDIPFSNFQTTPTGGRLSLGIFNMHHLPLQSGLQRHKTRTCDTLATRNVRHLSSPLWQMTSLTSLYLNNNALTSIPSEISLLVNLAHLNVSFNQLRNIPPEMGDMTSLRELLLNNNNISTLPTQLGKLFKLCKLVFTNL